MKIKLCDKSSIATFKYIYLFIMVIYMAQIVPTTNRMVAGIGSPWFPFLLPIFLTILLLIFHPINFRKKKLWKLLLVCFIWEVAVTIEKRLLSASEQSFQFFLFYSIIMAYIHIQVYGKQLVPLYESIIVLLCKISLPCWLLSVLAPSVMSGIASLFPESNLGNNILFLFNYIDISSEHHLRNSGCSWEPGRFAIMIILGLFCNIIRNGKRINANAVWMIVTLLTTMSTTGYSIALFMYILVILKRSKPTYRMLLLVIMLPLVFTLYNLDFMGQKISEQANLSNTVPELYTRFNNASKYKAEGEYVQSLGRFESMYFEGLNVTKDPILGYGRNVKHSYFYQSISSNYYLTGGLIKVFGMYGLILGLIFYTILYKSSRRISREFNCSNRSLLFLILILSSVSYEVFIVPIFMSFDVFSTHTEGLKE